jgi:hypothetical protein
MDNPIFLQASVKEEAEAIIAKILHQWFHKLYFFLP